MHHTLPLITTIAMGFGLALIMGFIAVRIKLPALIGYLLAGVIELLSNLVYGQNIINPPFCQIVQQPVPHPQI